MGHLKKNINKVQCIEMILVLITAARKHFLLDENDGKDFMIPNNNATSFLRYYYADNNML